MPRTCSVLLLLVSGSAALAGDWPQWLGPNRNSATTERVAPWKTPPQVVWRHQAGEGNGTPVVGGGHVFLHAKVKDKDEEEVRCFDARTGKQIWRTAYARKPFLSLFGNGPRASPAIDGERVYTFGITGVLTCFAAETGQQTWQVDCLKEFAATPPKFGMSCSPLIEGQAVLVNVGGKNASVVALDKLTGKVLWKSQDDPASYSSPIAFGEGKDRQVLFLTQQGLLSLAPAQGTPLWRFPYVDKLFESSSTPLRAGNLILASSITLGSVGLELTDSEGKMSVKQLWKNDDLTSYFASPVTVGDETIYLVTGTKPFTSFTNHADLHCLSAKTGRDLWRKENVGEYHATLIRTGDNKLLMLEEPGDLVLIEPDPKAYRELARAKVCGQSWTHPALADGRIYVRDGRELICLQFAP